MRTPSELFIPALVLCLGLSFAPAVLARGMSATVETSYAEASTSLPVAAVEAADDGDERAILELRLALIDALGLPADVEAAVRRDVEAVFRRMSVTIDWHEPKQEVEGAGEEEESYYLKVMLSGYDPASIGRPAMAMGICFGSAFPPDAVWLFGPVIEHTLYSDAGRFRPLAGLQQARAYARVIAHEVVHAIAGIREHSTRGLMAASLSRDQLMAQEIDIDERTISAVREGISRIYLTEGR